ncbi:amino acid ABC transporter permease [Arthrobacter sp. ISL-65]|uniref:amino acid ABC transporter permease n=1 Tax=Arthrobacter sp. ISL-65 TaxID=2819112 RepID=UPI001BEB143E|nr:amino acid ABC transporter permease [Arthrobacter sp. ISL-65]MBT2548926.1 amino acid ABC transporter permease [Arthrobacter sp. ISL-65]
MSTVSTTKPVGVTAPRKVIPLRRPGRIVSAIIILVLVAQGILVLFTNPNFEWGVVASYLFAPPIMQGLWLTLWLTVVAMVLGIALGVVLAIMRLSSNPVASYTAWAFVWFFRGTPLLVQLVFWYNLAVLFPSINLGIPFGGPVFASLDANKIITPIIASLLGLVLNEAAYMAEIVRSGITAVDKGQVEAASALGMNRAKTLRRIILPQASRVMIPPAGNETITMLKSTSLVSVVAVADLMYQVNLISAQTFQTIPLPIVASLWYLLATSVLSVGQSRLERKFGRSDQQVSGQGNKFKQLFNARRPMKAGNR